ncbi:MAG: phosphatidate cytidylyltransferase [Planctomycetes bacterium]|nr:phosphatidate cytidylyltransferase [Planctomycetota bacterium]
MSHAWTRISIGAALMTGTLALLVADVTIDQGLGAPVSPCFWMVLLGVLLVGAWEFARMLRLKGYPCRPGVAMVFTAVLVACAWAEVHDQVRHTADFADPLFSCTRWFYIIGPNPETLALAVLVLVTYTLEVVGVERARGDLGRASASVAWTLLIVLSVGLLGTFLARIRFFESPATGPGLPYLLLTLGTIKVGDIGAYAVGSTLGRRQLVPTLSPKKTWAGLMSALATGVAAALAIGSGWIGLAWWKMALFGLTVGTAGVLGDLGESLIKRTCGVKDSGSIPGFGGALDILDSILGAAPIAYLMLVVLTGHAPMR